MNDFNPFLSELSKLWYSKTRRKMHWEKRRKKNEGRTEDIKNLELYHKLIAILTHVSCFLKRSTVWDKLSQWEELCTQFWKQFPSSEALFKFFSLLLLPCLTWSELLHLTHFMFRRYTKCINSKNLFKHLHIKSVIMRVIIVTPWAWQMSPPCFSYNLA